MSLESIIIFVIIGLVSGWLAGMIWQGGGFGLIGNLVVGVVGAFVGSFIFGLANISIGGSIVTTIIAAVIGALILLFLINLVFRKRR
ncbi:MAG: GlsB/YeaQ/YmgE family stress response membrane protein [Spirochaetes bacterium]|nr:GlsB/YeaQ/YmgE family stress response membrane protein [Spirochaetota bacterium]